MATETTTTRADHIAWCKRRALEYCGQGDAHQAIASMVSDMGKHPETERHAALPLMMQLLWAGHLDTPEQARKFIEGFH